MFVELNIWRDRFAAVPYETGGKFEPRYYQYNAIEKSLAAIALGKDRILLMLATGTGKTSLLADSGKLFNARGACRTGRPVVKARRPRIWFPPIERYWLTKPITASPDSTRCPVRITPAEYRKKGGVPKNGSAFFTIFQSVMTDGGNEGTGVSLSGLSAVLFDRTIIDECHRGGAKDGSEWRGILEYFGPAVKSALPLHPSVRKC